RGHVQAPVAGVVARRVDESVPAHAGRRRGEGRGGVDVCGHRVAPVVPRTLRAAPPVLRRVDGGRGLIVDPHYVARDTVIVRGHDRHLAGPLFEEESDAGIRGSGDLVARECPFRVRRVAVERNDQDADVPGVDRIGGYGSVAFV